METLATQFRSAAAEVLAGRETIYSALPHGPLWNAVADEGGDDSFTAQGYFNDLSSKEACLFLLFIAEFLESESA